MREKNLLVSNIRNADFYFSTLHQKIAFALTSLSFKNVVLLCASSLYHRFISTTVFQYNQSHLVLWVSFNLWVLSRYYTTPLEQKGTFWLHYKLHAQLYLGAKRRPALLVWRKGEKLVWMLTPYGCACLFSPVLASNDNKKIQRGSNTVLLDDLKKPKIYSQ